MSNLIIQFWSAEREEESRRQILLHARGTWGEHRDINDAMLATGAGAGRVLGTVGTSRAVRCGGRRGSMCAIESIFCCVLSCSK